MKFAELWKFYREPSPRLGAATLHEQGGVAGLERDFAADFAEGVEKLLAHGSVEAVEFGDFPRLWPVEKIDQGHCRPIPEGWLLDIAEETWKLNPRDRMGLLLACCRDCIGAASVREAKR